MSQEIHLWVVKPVARCYASLRPNWPQRYLAKYPGVALRPLLRPVKAVPASVEILATTATVDRLREAFGGSFNFRVELPAYSAKLAS